MTKPAERPMDNCLWFMTKVEEDEGNGVARALAELRGAYAPQEVEMVVLPWSYGLVVMRKLA